MRIPKIIHYCWFGNNPPPVEARNYIASWKKYLPDYKVKEWNENNFDLHICPYVEEAYKAKKWAFVSDYSRFWILYNYGGLYFDTDVELIKGIYDIIDYGPFMGSDPNGNKGCRVAAGLGLSTTPHHPFYKKIIGYYDGQHFELRPNIYNDETVVTKITKLLAAEGYKGNRCIEIVDGISIYPPDFFCPMDAETGTLNITSNTRSIHWYMSSWKSKDEIVIHKKAVRLYRKIPNRFGKIIGQSYENVAKYIYFLKEEGIVGVNNRMIRKINRDTRQKRGGRI